MAQRERATGEQREPAGSGRTADARAGTSRPAGPGGAAAGASGGSRVPGTAGRNRLGWVALAVAAVLLVWQVAYAITVAGPGLDGREVYTSAWLLVSLVLAVGSAVLGIVAASQRVTPRWTATTALAVGTYVFLVCIATWAGSIISSS